MNTNRMERVRELLREKKADEILISDELVIQYLTGIRLHTGERMLALLIKADGERRLFLNELFPQKQDWGMPIEFYNDNEDAVMILSQFLSPDALLAVDKNWPARFLLRLQELLPGKRYMNSSCIIDYVRMVKDEDEQRKMIESSRINDTVMAKVVKVLEEKHDEIELEKITRGLYLQSGCEDVAFTPIAAFAGNAADPHHGADRTVGKKGDCVVIDIGGLYQGYCSDMTRTVFLGSVSERQREIYEIVLEANRRGIAAAKPGNRMCDVDLAARNYIEEKGFGKYFTHRTGHSIGMEDHEFGDVSSVNEDIIKPGQCFSVEPGIYIAEENIGVRIEDLVLITGDGCKVLNAYPKDLIVVPFAD